MALGLALAAAPLLFGRPKRRGMSPGQSAALRDYQNANPQGELSATDLAYGERYRSSGNEAVGQGLLEAKQAAARQLAARGLSGGVAEQGQADAEAGAAGARVNLNRDVANLLEHIRQGNVSWGRTKAGNLFSARLGIEAGNQQSFDAQQSAWWNSALEYLPQLAGLQFPGRSGLPTNALAAAGANSGYVQPARR